VRLRRNTTTKRPVDTTVSAKTEMNAAGQLARWTPGLVGRRARKTLIAINVQITWEATLKISRTGD
jgi:hypothetical protein